MSKFSTVDKPAPSSTSAAHSGARFDNFLRPLWLRLFLSLCLRGAVGILHDGNLGDLFFISHNHKRARSFSPAVPHR